MDLTSVRIERFKAISDAPFEMHELNVIVGANNSGKSSIIQGLHLGIAALQTIQLTGNWTADTSISTSLSPSQLIYAPSDDVYALGPGARLLERIDSAIRMTFTLATGEQPSITIRKGRNRNILVGVDSAVAARRLASLEDPFSVFSPGLAGIAKAEQYVSDGVLLRTIARGDANLVLRNILLRLWNTPQWDPFLLDLRDIFPQVDFSVEFRPETDETIGVHATVGATWVPLELVGTGVLQAAQILAYIHRFSPSLIVLDEPDSHLHPNNQRLLCSLLRKVAAEKDTQILLTTHSRHILDALENQAQFLWVRNGTVESAGVDDEIGVLLDIGALDVKERAAQPGTRFIILTEDTATRHIETVCAASGIDMNQTVVMPYHGATKLKHLRPLLNVIRAANPTASVIVHQDRDYMSDAEVTEWENSVRRYGVDPFVTLGVDIESQFLNPVHLAGCNPGVTEVSFSELIAAARIDTLQDSVEHYVNGRVEPVPAIEVVARRPARQPRA